MSAHRWTVRGFAVAAMLMGVFVLTVGQASASLGEFSLSKSFGPFGIGENIAVDESTGDVYVYDANKGIEKFDADGNPVNFSALGSNKIAITVGGGDETELAVDNSSGPAKGDIYLAGGDVKVYGSSGDALGKLTEVAGRPWGEVACGVAVDGVGDVYVGLYPSFVNKYVPTANPVTNNDYATSLSGANEICNIAADPDGGIYTSTWSESRQGPDPVVKYSPQFGGAKQVLAEAGGTLAVANSSSAEMFTVTRHDEIQQYDESDSLLSTFGTEGADYHSVAVNAKNGRLYASDYPHGDVEIWQGVVIPKVSTDQATSLNPVSGSAMLNGSINPEGVSVESCSFQYGIGVSYGSLVPCAQLTPLTGTNTVSVSADVSEIPPNHAYHYRLVTTDGHGTRYGADQTFTILVLPTVEDQSPSVSLITRDSAKLTGTIDPEQVDATYHFEYGTTESYGNSTPTAHTGVSAGDTTVSQQLGELLPDKTYHYRLVANNIAGTILGLDHTFKAGGAAPPMAVTGGSSGVAENNATIGGAVSTNGLPTSYGFEIGTSTDYGPPTGLGTVGAGLDETPVSLSLTGLLPGATYHYRLTATNIDGTSYGADETFTTGMFTNTFAEPPAPLPFVTVPSIAFPSEPKAAVVKKKTKSKGKKVRKRSKTKGKKRSKNKKKK